ncbi:MAG: protein kinase [Gemmatimonadaceae bacterium]
MPELVERLRNALAGRYRIERELGRGGMGVVLLAHDLKHGRLVAIKALRPEVAQPVSADRFLREIRIAARLQHPNILALIDSGEADGVTYFVMPFVPGESLLQRLGREKQLGVEQSLQIAQEVADALSYAHEHGVIHRDIKPGNILLASGHALVADFGIARAITEAAGNKLTETGIVVGTAAYMSPEQASGEGELDHRTDIYSLGCVLYEMLAGTPPFTGSYQAVLSRKARDPVPSIRVVRDTVPAHVEQVVMKALAKVPADRFATARQLADALAGDVRALALKPQAQASRRRWLFAGAVAALLFVGGTYVLIAGAPWSDGTIPPTAGFAKLTAESGVEWFPSLSADSKWMVYSGQQSGNRDIYLQSVGGQVPINLTKDSPADDDQPAFSPDGERIAFRSARDGGGIFVMGRTGEGTRRITNTGFRPTWSHDGTQLAFTTENVEMNPGNSESFGELWVVNASGGQPRKLPIDDAMLPSWSPHGHRIAYTHRLGAAADAGIWTSRPEGGERVPLVTARGRSWSPTWSPDGRYVYFSSDRGGSMNLWRIAIDEESGRARGVPEPVTTPATFLAHPSVGGDGRHIVYVSALTTINIQRLTLDPISGTVVGEPVPVTTGSRQWSTPDPSPDGEWVAFYTLTQPEGDLYVSRPDGSGLRQLTSDTAVDRMPRWSPDGRWLTFFSNRAGQLEIWKIRSDGSELQQLTHQHSSYPVWSPDGSRIAGSFRVPNSRDLVLLDPNRTAEEQRPQVLPRPAEGQFLVNSWSQDGERLAGQRGSTGGMVTGILVYSINTRTYEKVADFGEWPVWLPDNRRILFVANRNAFYIVDSRTKQVRKIFSVEHDVIGPPRLTRDGRTAYFTRRVTEGDVWLLTLRSDR